MTSSANWPTQELLKTAMFGRIGNSGHHTRGVVVRRARAW